jgi:polyhydroxybutyrate depolymerase
MTDSIRRKTLEAAGAFALLAALAISGPDGTVAASPASEHCQPSRPHAAGLTEHRVEVDGLTRTFMLHVPRSYTGETAVPLVFDLQASGISPAVELQVTGMDRAAEETGFVVVLPQAAKAFPGGGTTWNVPFEDGDADDVGFVEKVIEAVGERLCIDTARVYAAGFSGGARFASELACKLPNKFAAISAVAGLRHPQGHEGACRTGAPAVPIIAFHSTDDPVNSFEHEPERSPPYWTYGVEEAVSRWSGLMKCQPPAEEQLSETVRRLTWGDCRDGARIEFYRLSVSGHTWPGSSFAFPEELGTTDRTLDATSLTVRFFDRFRRE